MMGRIVGVLAVYAVGAVIVLAGSGWLRRVLALPPLFETIIGWSVVVGAPLAALLAWSYPHLGEDAPARRGGAREGESTGQESEDHS